MMAVAIFIEQNSSYSMLSTAQDEPDGASWSKTLEQDFGVTIMD